MPRKATAPDLFADLPATTSRPKSTFSLPSSPAELAQLRADVWAQAPTHVRGIIGSKQCICTGGNWPAIEDMDGPELVACLDFATLFN